MLILTSARCTSPSATFGDIAGRSPSQLAPTSRAGRHALSAAELVHGSGEQPRLERPPIVQPGPSKTESPSSPTTSVASPNQGATALLFLGTTTSSQRMPTARCSPFDRIPMSTPQGWVLREGEVGWVCPANARLSRAGRPSDVWKAGMAPDNAEEGLERCGPVKSDEAPAYLRGAKPRRRRELEEAGPSGFESSPTIEQGLRHQGCGSCGPRAIDPDRSKPNDQK